MLKRYIKLLFKYINKYQYGTCIYSIAYLVKKFLSNKNDIILSWICYGSFEAEETGIDYIGSINIIRTHENTKLVLNRILFHKNIKYQEECLYPKSNI